MCGLRTDDAALLWFCLVPVGNWRFFYWTAAFCGRFLLGGFDFWGFGAGLGNEDEKCYVYAKIGDVLNFGMKIRF